MAEATPTGPTGNHSRLRPIVAAEQVTEQVTELATTPQTKPHTKLSSPSTPDGQTPDRPPAPPGPSPWSPGVLAGIATDPMTAFSDLRRRYGPVVRVRVGRGGFYLVCDPAAVQEVLVGSAKDYAKGFRRRSAPEGTGFQPLSILLGDGLLTSDGDVHRTRRRLLAPMFHRQRVTGFGDQFVAAANQHSAGWRDGCEIDVHEAMSELTLAMVARTVFDVDLHSEVVATIRRAVAANLRLSRFALVPGAQRLDKLLPVGPTRRARDARHDLTDAVQRMVDSRRRAGAGGSDLLSMLIAARDADTGAPLDDAAVRDEALTILLAGHETTANALSWAYHLLGGCPRAADTMAAELDRVIGDRLPTADDVTSLPYTQAVFAEAMRLYPPAWILIRRTLREVSLGGYRIPSQVTVVMSQWVVHRDPELWPDPDAFVPERWLDVAHALDAAHPLIGSATDRRRFAYFPFGGGTRQCVGTAFAEMEGALVLATLGRRWRFERVPGAEVTPIARVVLRPRDGVPMVVRSRQ